MKKNILYMRTEIYDQELVAGGSVSHTLGVIRELHAYDYNIICASSVMYRLLQKEKIHVLKKLFVPQCFSIFRWKINCLISNIFFFFQIWPLISKHKPNIIYQRYSILNCVGLILGKIKKIPLFLEYNGSESWVIKNWVPKKFFSLYRLIDWFEILNLRYADGILVVSQVLFDELIKRGIKPEKILLNPNGVDTNAFDPESLNAARLLIRKQLAIESRFVFGFVGTFSMWHGIEVLEYMIPALIAQCPQVYFLLIGDGPLLASLKKLFFYQSINTEFVYCTGLLTHEQARNYLSACDAFLAPNQANPDGSKFFGSPTKLFEYMSLAKPIIGSHLEQVADILHPAIENLTDESSIAQKTGILIDPRDKDGFIQAALKLMHLKKDDIHLIGLNARAKVCNRYSWAHHVKRIIEFMQQRLGIN